MEVGSMISRRTRSRFDDYYRCLHDTIKNPHGGTSTIKHQESSETEIHDDDVISADDSEAGSDDEAIKKKRKYVAAKKKVGRPPKKRLDFVSLLEGSGWRRDNDLVRENIEGDDVRENSGLPFKFKFEDDEDDQSRKEMEIDRLFNDLEVGLWESNETAPAQYSCVNDDECSDVDQSPAARCSRSDHDQFLDEQIGIICRFCHTLLLDIKYVLPPFQCVESPERERGEWKRWEESKNFDQIHELKTSSDCANLESSSIPSRGTVFDLIPTSEKELYPHQLEAFEFMWRNIAGDIHLNNLQSLPPNGGQGCIISHAPGTGKTRLTIVFLQTLMRLYPKCRPVIIAPRGMLLTWAHELNKWDAPIPFHNLNDPKLLPHHQNAPALSHRSQKDHVRFAKILSWIKGGSILGVGYRLFEELANDKFKNILLESPSIVVLDEGHTPRNDQSLMWKALTKVTTQRRIILSGTPFQNNLDELCNTLALVDPPFSRKQRGRRKQNNSANSIKKLKAMIQPFVHTHKGTILQKTLPGLKDCLIILKPTPLQQKLLEQNTGRVRNFLDQTHLASLISVHPSLVAEEAAFADHRRRLKALESDPKAGVKTHFLINLIQISSRIHEKVLIFSGFIKPLLHIKKLLKSHFAYKEGREVMYIDGDLSMKQRQRLITSFNDKNGEAKVLLASQRACCEGISLVGASRVVLLDVSWNPSVERQAICRAYRLGQEKVVYVYHLITLMEAKKYARQAEKDRISELLFGEGERGACREGVCEDRVLEAMVDHQGGGAMFERIVHQPKESDFGEEFWFCGS